MHVAAYYGGLDAVKVLSEHGADVHVTNNVSYHSLKCVYQTNMVIRKALVITCNVSLCLRAWIS